MLQLALGVAFQRTTVELTHPDHLLGYDVI
jgi:hypothetical protein